MLPAAGFGSTLRLLAGHGRHAFTWEPGCPPSGRKRHAQAMTVELLDASSALAGTEAQPARKLGLFLSFLSSLFFFFPDGSNTYLYALPAHTGATLVVHLGMPVNQLT